MWDSSSSSFSSALSSTSTSSASNKSLLYTESSCCRTSSSPLINTSLNTYCTRRSMLLLQASMLEAAQVLHAAGAQVCMLEFFSNIVLHLHLHCTGLEQPQLGLQQQEYYFPSRLASSSPMSFTKTSWCNLTRSISVPLPCSSAPLSPSPPSLCWLVFLLREISSQLM